MKVKKGKKNANIWSTQKFQEDSGYSQKGLEGHEERKHRRDGRPAEALPLSQFSSRLFSFNSHISQTFLKCSFLAFPKGAHYRYLILTSINSQNISNNSLWTWFYNNQLSKRLHSGQHPLFIMILSIKSST